jgi:tetratricopeptide (TPR) repeat protein
VPAAASAAAQRIVAVLDRHTLAVRLAGAYAADLCLDLEMFAHSLEQDPLDVPEGEVPRAVMLAFSQSTVALSPDAQRLFAALAAFATPSFGRSAALALAKGMGLAAPKQSVDLLVLRALVSASIDKNMPLESDRERLRLHPLLRAFASEHLKLWAEKERDVASHTVALYYVTYFNRTTDKGLSVDELNIIGALEWAHSHAQDELVVALCSGMQSFWLYRLRMSASQVFLPWGVGAAKAIAEQTSTRDDRLRAADLALTYGQMLRYTGRVDEAEAELEQNLVIRQEVGDHQGEGEVLSALGQLYQRSGRTALAEQYFLEALAILQERPNRRSEGLVRLRMARIARR